MQTIHLVYPYGPRKAAPWSIGNNLARLMRLDGYRVKQYDWNERLRMDVSPGDILVGHPHDEPGYAFTDNLYQFDKAIALAPWNGTDEYRRRLDQVSGRCAVFAIAGPGYAIRLPSSFQRLDMAINPTDYPEVRGEPNQPGMRRFLYIGCTLSCKGPDFLAAVAAALPDVHFGHIGSGLIPGFHPWGYVPTDTNAGQAVVAGYDVIMSLGQADANPATILEGISWGLYPIITQESGWTGIDSIPYGDLDAAVALIEQVNSASVLTFDREYVNYFTWDRFYAPIKSVLDDSDH